MADDGPFHVPQPDDPNQDTSEPLRDPINPDEGEPDPFDAAAHGPHGEPDVPDWVEDGSEWSVEEEPAGVMEEAGSSLGSDPAGDGDDLGRTGVDDSDVEGSDDEGPDPDGPDPDDPWSDGSGDGASSLDVDDAADHSDLFDDEPGPDESSTPAGLGWIETTVVDALAELDGSDLEGLAPPALGGWSDGAAISEPADTVWAVPVVDPTPGFIDLDLLD